MERPPFVFDAHSLHQKTSEDVLQWSLWLMMFLSNWIQLMTMFLLHLPSISCLNPNGTTMINSHLREFLRWFWLPEKLSRHLQHHWKRKLFWRNIKKDFHDLLNYFAWKRNPNEIGQQDWNIWNGENSSEQEGTLFLKETFNWNQIKWEPSIYFEGTGLVGLHNGGDDGGSDLDNTNTNAKTEFRIQETKYKQRDGWLCTKWGWWEDAQASNWRLLGFGREEEREGLERGGRMIGEGEMKIE